MTLQEYIASKRESKKLVKFLDTLAQAGIPNKLSVVQKAQQDLRKEYERQYIFEQHPRRKT